MADKIFIWKNKHYKLGDYKVKDLPKDLVKILKEQGYIKDGKDENGK